jgi:hypothetical protein
MGDYKGTHFNKCFIMLCTNQTEKECIGRNLFGDRANRFEILKEIQKDDIGFLLNVSKNQLIGVFRSTSEAQLDIESDAWGGQFRSQVRVEPLGKLKRLEEATYILANVGISLVSLSFGALVPISPIQKEEIVKKLIEKFDDCSSNK